MQNPKSPFIGAKEAYKFTPFCERTFNTLVARGFFPSYEINGRRYFKAAEVVATIEKHRVATNDEVLK